MKYLLLLVFNTSDRGDVGFFNLDYEGETALALRQWREDNNADSGTFGQIRPIMNAAGWPEDDLPPYDDAPFEIAVGDLDD